MIVDERLRARRKVTESDGMWTVTDSEFATTDQALARAVAAELDRVEPLDRAITSSEAVTRAREILNEMDEMLDAARPDHDRFDVLRRELDVLQEHVRRYTR